MEMGFDDLGLLLDFGVDGGGGGGCVQPLHYEYQAPAPAGDAGDGGVWGVLVVLVAFYDADVHTLTKEVRCWRVLPAHFVALTLLTSWCSFALLEDCLIVWHDDANFK